MDPFPARILIVAEAAAAAPLCRSLESAGVGAEVRLARSLAAYREAVRQQPPELAIIHMDLPDGSPLEVLTSPPEAGPCPILLVTGPAGEARAAAALKTGALDYAVQTDETWAALPHKVGRVWREWQVRQERQRFRELLREHEARYQTLEAVGEGLWDWNMVSGEIYLSPTWLRLFGYDPEALQLNYDCLVRRLHSEDLPAVLEMLQEHLAGPRPAVAVEFRVRSQSGAYKYLLARGQVAERDAAGLPLRMLGSVTDITSRRLAEERLKVSESRYRHIVETAKEGIWAMDGDFRTTYVNQVMAAMLGYTPQEMIGQPVTAFMFPADLTDHRGKMVRRQQGVDERYERRFRCRDGSELWTLVSARALSDEQGVFQGSFAMFTDITAHKQAQAALEESLSLLEATLESTADGILVADLEGRLVSWNRKFAELWHLTAEILQRQDEVQALAYVQDQLQDPEGFLQRVQELYSQPEATDFATLHFKDGRVVERYSVPQYLDERIVGRVWSFRDVTARVRAEEALKKSEATLKTIFRAAPVGMGVVHDRVLLLTNEQMVLMTGYSSEALQGQSSRLLYPSQEEFLRVGTEKYYLMRQQGTGTIETRWRHRDGHHIDILLSSSFIDPADETAGTIFTAQDITARKQAEAALRESEARYRLLFENAPLGIVHYNHEGTTLDANDKFAAIVGAPRASIIGFNPLHQLQDDQMRLAVAASLAGQTGYYEGEYVSVIGHHHTHIRAFYQGIYSDTGALLGGVGIFEDYNEKFLAEQNRQQLEAQLYQAQKMEAIGTLAGGIAHDFNNILMAIIGYTEMTMDYLPSGSLGEKYLREVRKASHRARDLVEQILTFSRKHQGEQQIFDLKDIVKEAVKLLRASLPATIEIHLNLTSQGVMRGDPTKMHQVLMNLCTNAYHAMPQGGILTIDLTDLEPAVVDHPDLPPGRYYKLAVTDTGEGIDPTIQARIFEPYFTTKEIGRGTGMGLAVVLGIIKTHKGAITLDSQPGHGSTFTFYLPQTTPQEAPAKPRPSLKLLSGRGRILCVDDETPLTEFSRAALEMMGYEVVATTSSLEARELFRAQPDRFDLVITDLTMPKLTGIDLARQLLAIRPDIPILLCTGYSDRFTREDIKKIGIVDFIIKPIGIHELGEKVKAILTARRPE